MFNSLDYLKSYVVYKFKRKFTIVLLQFLFKIHFKFLHSNKFVIFIGSITENFWKIFKIANIFKNLIFLLKLCLDFFLRVSFLKFYGKLNKLFY